MHDIMWQNLVVQNEHFVYAFVDINVVSGNDVFDIRFCKPMSFCTMRFNVRNMIIIMTCSGSFGVIIQNDVCFIALTFAGSLGRRLNTRPSRFL